MSSQTPNVSPPRDHTQYVTSSPDGFLSFGRCGWEGGGRWCWSCSGGRRSEEGGGVEDQLEVSEWTLPGPSVGEVTDEGVGASCQPPFAWEKRRRKETEGRGGGVHYFHIHYWEQLGQTQWGTTNGKSRGRRWCMNAAWNPPHSRTTPWSHVSSWIGGGTKLT